MEIFVTIVKEWKLSKIVTNSSILDVSEVLDLVVLIIDIVVLSDN